MEQHVPHATVMTRDDRRAASRLVAEIRDLALVPPPAFVADATVRLRVASEPVAANQYLKDDSGQWAAWRATFAQRLIDSLWTGELERQAEIRRRDPERARREFDAGGEDGRRQYTLDRVRRAIVTGTADMSKLDDSSVDVAAVVAANRRATEDERRLFGKRLPDVRNGAVDTLFGLFIALAEKMGMSDLAKSIRGVAESCKSWLADFGNAPAREHNEAMRRQGVSESYHYIESGPGAGQLRGVYESMRQVRAIADTAPMLRERGYDATDPRARVAAAELGPDAFPHRSGADRWDPARARREESERQARNRAIGNLMHMAGPFGRIGFKVFEGESLRRARERETLARIGTPEETAADSWAVRTDRDAGVAPARPAPVTAPARPAPVAVRRRTVETRERQFRAALQGAVRTWTTDERMRPGLAREQKRIVEKSGEEFHDWVGKLDSRQLALLHRVLLDGRTIDSVTDADVRTSRGIYSSIRADRIPEIHRALLDPSLADLPRPPRLSTGEQRQTAGLVLAP